MPSIPPRSVPHPARGSVLRLAAVAAIATSALAACSHDPAPPPPPPPAIAIDVVHDGATTPVRVRKGRTVGDAVDKAKVEATEGQELSAQAKEPLGPNGNEPTYLVDGEAASRAEVLTAAATIEVADGEDTTEPTEVKRQEAAVTGLPDALQYVQFAGQTGIEDVTVGTKSGEVVSRVPVTPVVPAHRATGNVVALTFDDGPHPTYTPEILDILKAKKAPATFCMIGTMVQAHPELAKRVADEGHQLCNHTLDHVEGLEKEPDVTVKAQMDGGRDAIVDATGQAPAFYRPPGGSLGPVIYEEAAAHDEAVLYWAVDPRDWKKPTTDELVLSVVSQLKPGAIILLHDGGGTRDATVAALPRIIDEIRSHGYTITAPISGRPQVG